ncbi:O-antigen ligase family protein [Sphingomonas sp.]|uniref:O-antigen ligase family protein n=1 Tax=Sphingomonas sp. TaxID=28214 RepID=UPI0017B3A782|nr:O-antigen ligase family protein [Sphingomonas sp.]MBA3512401.1 O-antigen ligase family protein [Sphingomonas sp.]
MRPPAVVSNLVWAMIFSLAFMQPAIPLLGYITVPTDFLFVALCLAWLWALGTGRSAFTWDKAFGWLALYFAAVLASVIASDSPMRSAPALLKNLYLLSLPVIIVNLVRTRDDFRTAIQWWLAGSAVVALVGAASLALFLVDPASPLLDYTRFHFGTLPPGNYPRLQLTFFNANMACNYLTVSLVLLLVARRLDWVGRRLFAWLLAGFVLSAALTLSPGLGGIVLAIGVWVWLLERKRRPALATMVLWGSLLASLLFVVAMAVTPIIHPTAPFLIQLPLGIELAPAGRLMIWIDAVRNFIADPLLGRGIGMDPVEVRYLSPSGDLQTLTEAHNSFLNIAVQCGIVGLAALTALVVFVLRRSLPLRLLPGDRNVAIVGLGLAFLVAFGYEGLGGSFEDARHLWVLFGLFVVAWNLDSPDDPPQRTVQTD